MKHGVSTWIFVGAFLIGAVACGTEPSSGPSAADTPTATPNAPESPVATPNDKQLYEGVGLVLNTDKPRPPELCLSGTQQSDPPQCAGDGIPIEGWEWKDVLPPDGDRSYPYGVYGDYKVTGRYDGKTFEIVDAELWTEPESNGSDDEITTPCSEPEGGWIDVDPNKTSDEDRVTTFQRAESHPDSAGSWIDGGILNLAFTGDLAEHEAIARETWGGPLCVTEFTYSFNQLRKIQRNVAKGNDLETTWSDIDVIENQVLVGVLVEYPESQAQLDAQFGEGSVRMYPALRPVE